MQNQWVIIEIFDLYIIKTCFFYPIKLKKSFIWSNWGGCSGHGHDRMVVGFTAPYAISAYHHWICEFESRSWRGILDTTLCNQVCQCLVVGWWFSPVSSTNKTDCHYINWNIVESGVKHHKPNPWLNWIKFLPSYFFLHNIIKILY